MNDTSSPSSPARRDFLKKSALGAGFMVLPSFVAGASPTERAPNSRLNIAIIGVAGKGRGPTVESAGSENVVALCDVDMGHVAAARDPEAHHGKDFNDALTKIEKKGARWFTDYREMFTEMGDEIDAVIISTPDHMHFPIAMTAINLGKHVYCEKPLTHTVDEARRLTAAAAAKGVVTQMGNQGHSLTGTRLVREWVQAGVIGEVREVHSWTDRPARFWQQGLAKPDHSKFIPVVPTGLRWDLWQGVAEPRAYDPAYVPFSWRAYLDYGCGSLGDMACHIMDAAYWALDLGAPDSIEASTTRMTGYSYPVSSLVTYEFPARGKMPPLTYKWYDGDMRPSLPAFLKDAPHYGQDNANGSLIVGEKAAILTDIYASRAEIVPRETFRKLRSSLPEPTLRRIKGSHLEEFYNAIRESRQASSDFSYSGPFTEMVLLGTIAQRLGRKLHFETEKGAFRNDAEATALMSKDYPDGWILS